MCNYGLKYIDKKNESYCVNCGQKLSWKYLKDKKYKMNKYQVIYTIRNLSSFYSEIIEAVNMKEAIYNFYYRKPNRFDILTIKLIE